jgi:hypothetical protein
MDGDVESNSRLQSIRCGLRRPTDGDVATYEFDASGGLFVAKMKSRKGMSMQLV